MSVWFMHREGISGGRAGSVMLVTLLLDEGFMALAGPLVIVLLGSDALFGLVTAVERRWIRGYVPLSGRYGE